MEHELRNIPDLVWLRPLRSKDVLKFCHLKGCRSKYHRGYFVPFAPLAKSRILPPYAPPIPPSLASLVLIFFVFILF